MENSEEIRGCIIYKAYILTIIIYSAFFSIRIYSQNDSSAHFNVENIGLITGKNISGWVEQDFEGTSVLSFKSDSMKINSEEKNYFYPVNDLNSIKIQTGNLGGQGLIFG